MSIPSAVSNPAPEVEIACDIAARGLRLGVVAVGLVWLILDGASALSVAYGIAVVLINLLISAYLFRWALNISLELVASVSLTGYMVRLAFTYAAVMAISGVTWFRIVPLGLSLIFTHLGLLVLEIPRISGTQAHPGLKPQTSARPAIGYRGRWQAKNPIAAETTSTH